MSMNIYIDYLRGKPMLLDIEDPQTFDGQVDTFADLPASTGSGDTYLVSDSTYIAFPPHLSGIYKDEATGWKRKAPYSVYFSDDNAVWHDNNDNTKKLAFELGNITTGNKRILEIPDKNGTLALLSDVGVSALGYYTIGTTGSGATYECDGTDDHLTFQQAHDEVESGSTIFILAGTYTFNDEITCTKSLTWLGADRDTVDLNSTLANKGAIKLDSGSDGSVIQSIGFSNQSTSDGLYSLSVGGVSNISIDSCKFSDTHTGISFTSTTYVDITKCFFDSGIKIGILYSSGNGNHTIEKNVFYNVDDSIAFFNANPLRRSIISKNYFWGDRGINHQSIARWGHGSATPTACMRDNKFFANHFRCSYPFLIDDGTDDSGGADNLMITKNSFEADTSVIAILFKGVTDSTIEGNTIDGCDEYLIRLEDSTNNGFHCDNITVNDNNGDASDGIYAYSEEDSNQDNNLLLGNSFVEGSSGTFDIQGANTVAINTFTKSITSPGSDYKGVTEKAVVDYAAGGGYAYTGFDSRTTSSNIEDADLTEMLILGSSTATDRTFTDNLSSQSENDYIGFKNLSDYTLTVSMTIDGEDSIDLGKNETMLIVYTGSEWIRV